LWIVDREEDKGTTGFRNRVDLPFHYRGGLIGYLGYEIRHETQKYLQEQQGVSKADKISEPEISESTSCTQPQDGNKIPSAAFFLARQSMLFYHPTQTWYLIALVEDDSTNDIDENLRWMEDVRIQFKALGLASAPVSISKVRPDFRSPESKKRLEFALKRPKEIYERNIAECHEFIRMGESYELCLTTQLEADVCCIGSTSFDLYRTLRLRNPAPYSAYFRWNANERGSPEESGLVICSSSPEQFMSVTRQQPHPEIEPFFMAEAKPIKGTCARVLPQNGICRTDAEWREDERRARSLELSLKNRAENLMIVDLLRNDLSRVCKVGSVYVAKLMDIESFATVHQMVSTIRGTLSDTATPIDLLRASFPGGSMTGAPKIRTMELLDELEQGQPRGPYSGSLGYLSVNGCMSFNIIIRSAVLTPKWVSGSKGWHVSIGAGGAITALSEVQDEYDEMNLKAKAVVSAVQEWESTSTLSAVDHEESLPSSRQSQLMDTTGAGPSTT
jgi:para-aminobenzoate synthetase